MNSNKTHAIDASGEVLGRLASKAAHLLMGKDNPAYARNKDVPVFVEVRNIDKLKFTGNKMAQKQYWRYSGYPGGLKRTLMKDLWQKYPDRVFRYAVAGMLPANKFKKTRLSRLKILK